MSTSLTAPIAKKQPKELSIHNHTRTDNYYWLRERENPEVIEYLKKENEYTAQSLAHTTPLQEKIYNEIVGRIKQNDETVPYFSNGYFYYYKNEEGKEYDINCRKKGSLDASEEVIVDENIMAKGHDYFSAVGFKVSPNNKMICMGIDTVSRRLYTLRFKDLETNEFLEDAIPNTTGGCVWANDNKTIFYTKKDTTTLRSFKIFKHVLGTSQDQDVEVFHEKDDVFSCYVSKSKSGDYIFVQSYSTLSSEVRFLNADNPHNDFTIIHPREKNHEYDVWHFEDQFFILTNQNAKNFKLMTCEVSSPSKQNWKDFIPHRDNVLIENIELFKNHLVLEERKDGLTNIRVLNTLSNEEHYIHFEEEAYVSYIQVNREFNTNILRFAYGSLTTPNSLFDYDMDTKKRTLLKEQEVVGNFDKNEYQSERLYATADDGTKVPISLVYKKSTVKNSDTPLLLYAYGSYGASMDPYFSSVRLSLLDRGVIYAIAHIRGGQEMGRQWYEDGKFLKKKNTFTDFINCAEFLIEKQYTSADKLAIMGGSAGGLLMGAVINMRPDLFKAVAAGVPFVDVLTTMLDESIPLTTGEFEEWGNPKDKTYYDYILSYSPYDNVEAKEYPAMLVTTGLHDSQVQYWEPAKWVARLRDLKTDSNPLYLETNMEAGHGGASGRFRRHKETALEYAFLLDQLGIQE